MIQESSLNSHIEADYENSLPEMPEFVAGIRRAPFRNSGLSPSQKKLAIKNALRYIPPKHHTAMSKEFSAELESTGRIYGYRFRPSGNIQAKPVQDYQGKCLAGQSFQLMIDNNLDFDIALYPYELVTYGETGQVCQNWMQYRLIQAYLRELRDDQTLVIQSGHPLGVFASHHRAPRVVTTNGLMIGQFDNPEQFAKATAMGVANYGQMTAGGWMYIGPQGIVHGTYNTLAIAGRSKLGIPSHENLAGKLFVSSGLGGMSGAQGKAAMIAGCASIIAEVDASRVQTRHSQGWVSQVCTTPKEAFKVARQHQENKSASAIAYLGNVVDLLEFAVAKDIKIDLLSDQTSCHAVYEGGYCPQSLTFEERTHLLQSNPEKYRLCVDSSLKRHFVAVNQLVDRGSYFFDYGNAFMKSVFDAGVPEICRNGRDEEDGFIFPTYVEDILGPELFDYGYGPFRWVCLSGKNEDLELTDQAAASCIESLRPDLRYQDRDNLEWVRRAQENKLVVGTKARILYQDTDGRRAIALKFNAMVRAGKVGPIMLGRDHHDTGGTDSPYRETSNIKDGSHVMAEMATQCFAGNAMHGMSLVALHNGGGVGIGKSINGGFGLLLDGSSLTDAIIETAITWDVMGGVARRAWARNPNSIQTCDEFNKNQSERGQVTLPYEVDEKILEGLDR